MGWTVEPEPPAVLLHYSEDPHIAEFVPHVPRSNPGVRPAVWAIDPPRSPLYWFPRDCPRVTVWANTAGQRARLHADFGTDGRRLHAAPRAWTARIRDCRLFEYRFDPEGFDPWEEAEGQWIATTARRPIAVVPAGDLLARHAEAGVDLRLVSAEGLADLRAAVLASGLPFSIVRYRP